jgi:hypothetical protein
LARAWPGLAQTAAAYEIQRTPYDMGYRQAIEDLITGISDGNLPMLAALTGAADKLPYFDSANSMATADFPAWARSMLSQPGAADKLPYLTGANGAALTTLTSFARSLLDDEDAAAFYSTLGQVPAAQIRNDLPPDKAFRRGNILGTVSQSGGVPTGAVIERGSNSNGEYVRLADGTQICWNFEAGSADCSDTNTFLGSLYRGAVAWSFPAGFSAIPNVLVVTRTNSRVPGPATATTSASTLYHLQGVSSSTLTAIGGIAVGRWN